MMNCSFNKSCKCNRCGYVSPVAGLMRKCPAAGLGDRVESALASVGVTKERVSHAAKMVGVKDCGCEKRKRWLNEIGHKFFGIANRAPSDPPSYLPEISQARKATNRH